MQKSQQGHSQLKVVKSVAVRLASMSWWTRGGMNPNSLRAICPLRASRFALVCKLLPQFVEPRLVLIQSLSSIHKKAQLVLGFFMYGAQGRNRTIDTRIFSRQRDRFVNKINEIKA